MEQYLLFFDFFFIVQIDPEGNIVHIRHSARNSSVEKPNARHSSADQPKENKPQEEKLPALKVLESKGFTSHKSDTAQSIDRGRKARKSVIIRKSSKPKKVDDIISPSKTQINSVREARSVESKETRPAPNLQPLSNRELQQIFEKYKARITVPSTLMEDTPNFGEPVKEAKSPEEEQEDL